MTWEDAATPLKPDEERKPDEGTMPEDNSFQPDGGFVPDDNSFKADDQPFAEDHADGNGEGGFRAGEDFGGGADDTCRNCGHSGHFSRECTEPKKLTGECFNCGQVGHNKADCPNPTVERPFTGTCHVCQKEGHRASDCPEKPATVCRICNQEGHRAMECTAARFDFIPPDTAEMTVDEAWKAMHAADTEKDLDEFKASFWAYVSAMERDLFLSQTIIGINGKLEQKYVLAFSWSAKPRSKKLGEGWPSSPEENMERLKSCGVVCTSHIPVCGRCNEKGHASKHCKVIPDEEASTAEPARLQITCIICNETGHRARDCTGERVDPYACRNCKKPGHSAKECPEPRSAEGVECKRCGQTGHFARDCPNTEPREPMTCRNCGGEGHMAKECTKCRNCGEEGHDSRQCDKPKNPANTKCRNCDEMGHFSKDCPKPRDYSRVQCKNCGEFGHTVVRCKKPAASGGGDDWGNGEGGASVAGAASGGWETSTPNGAGANNTWNNDFQENPDGNAGW